MLECGDGGWRSHVVFHEQLSGHVWSATVGGPVALTMESCPHWNENVVKGVEMAEIAVETHNTSYIKTSQMTSKQS